MSSYINKKNNYFYHFFCQNSPLTQHRPFTVLTVKILTSIADKNSMRLFNIKELSHVLQIKSTTINELVGKGKIPYTKLPSAGGEVVRFAPQKIKSWLRNRPNINMDDKKYLARFKSEIYKESSCVIKELKELDKQFSERRENKGFYLVKVNSNEFGFLYYASSLPARNLCQVLLGRKKIHLNMTHTFDGGRFSSYCGNICSPLFFSDMAAAFHL